MRFKHKQSDLAQIWCKGGRIRVLCHASRTKESNPLVVMCCWDLGAMYIVVNTNLSGGKPVPLCCQDFGWLAVEAGPSCALLELAHSASNPQPPYWGLAG
eukprot:TRINITY_DN67419_c12_g1_i1.p2 TRINITY_DN67419_c12_g1~~TRINITY_DN67419_c12_g1_i1.p2  ORF type:complete len:100 (+),score=0.78 TRINITY_DN67419_c12_g1_i1:881-1180(+)